MVPIGHPVAAVRLAHTARCYVPCLGSLVRSAEQKHAASPALAPRPSPSRPAASSNPPRPRNPASRQEATSHVMRSQKSRRRRTERGYAPCSVRSSFWSRGPFLSLARPGTWPAQSVHSPRTGVRQSWGWSQTILGLESDGLAQTQPLTICSCRLYHTLFVLFQYHIS
jgi:hypothetical protein